MIGAIHKRKSQAEIKYKKMRGIVMTYVLIAVALLAVLVGIVITIKRNNAIRQGALRRMR